MAKWTITLNDVENDKGEPAVAASFELTEGEATENGHTTGATSCALTLEWLWATGQFQEILEQNEEEVLKFQIEQAEMASSRKSALS